MAKAKKDIKDTEAAGNPAADKKKVEENKEKRRCEIICVHQG